MSRLPSTNGSNGRLNGGQFAPGNRFGRGNPNAAKVARLRAAVLNAVSEDDIRLVVAKLVEQAKSGDLDAIRELLNRTVGRPIPVDDDTEPEATLTVEERQARITEILNNIRARLTEAETMADGSGI